MSKSFANDCETLFDEADSAGAASQDAVEELENMLGFRVPAQYRSFLLTHGAALFNGFEVYGICEIEGGDTPLWSDLRNMVRSHKARDLPGYLIPISDDGGDYTFYLVGGADGILDANHVVAYGPGIDGKQVATSFLDFICVARRSGVASLLT